MKRLRPSYIVLAFLFTMSCSPSGQTDPGAIREEIRSTIAAQQEAWNAGDLQGFMAGYWRSDSLRFASGGEVSYGWQTLLDRYRKGYPDKSAMGKLSFTELDIDVLGPETVLVFGKWQVDTQDAAARGYFTLLFKYIENGWRIVHDHTSSAEVE